MLDEIAREIRNAAANRNKSTMILLQVLLHANELEGVSPESFYERVGIERVWATEVRKMLSLSKLMTKHDLALTQTSK